jgi:hypothetical protein
VDFERSEEQQAIGDAVDALLARHAGAARAIELEAKGEYDHALDAALADAGFSGGDLHVGAGPLEAAQVVEAIARAGGVVAAGAQILVAPHLLDEPLPGPVALARLGDDGPVRFGAHARTLLLLAGDEARVVPLADGDAAVPSDVCIRAYDARSGSVDEPATMAISRHHFDFLVVNDRLCVQARTTRGMQVNTTDVASGEIVPIGPGDRIVPIPGRPEKLTLQIAFSESIGSVDRIDVSRTPPMKA